MASQAPAYARTGAPIAAGPIIVSIAKVFGLDLSADQTLVILPVVMFLYYCFGRALEAYNPKLGWVLGIAKQPAYSKEDAPAPEKGEELVAVSVPKEMPEQTDNTPRADLGEETIDDGQPFTGGMR